MQHKPSQTPPQGLFLNLLAILGLVVIAAPIAHAVPSYSRQTGMACSSCHYAPPELTPFGRTFKLEGYTFTTKEQVTDEGKDHNAALHLLSAFPLSVIFDKISLSFPPKSDIVK